MKHTYRFWFIRIIVFTPMGLLICFIGYVVLYVLALSGVVIIPESPWHYSAREFYLYHGRAIIQFEQTCVEYDEHLFYRLRNGASTFDNYEFRTTITNVDGHRINPYLSTQANTVILGDSFAQGWGVNDEDTVASVLTRDHGIKSLTYGVSSYSTARELLAMKQALANKSLRKPEHLIIFYCGNDYPENIYYLDHGTKTYSEQEFVNLTKRAKDNIAKPSLLVGPISKHIESLKNGFPKWIAIFRKRLDYGNLFGPELPVSCAEQVRAFKAVLNANNDVIRDLKISVVAFKGWGGKDEFGLALAASPVLVDGTVINVIINTLPNNSYYPLDGHMNVRGNKLMAKMIAESGQP